MLKFRCLFFFNDSAVFVWKSKLFLSTVIKAWTQWSAKGKRKTKENRVSFFKINLLNSFQSAWRFSGKMSKMKQKSLCLTAYVRVIKYSREGTKLLVKKVSWNVKKMDHLSSELTDVQKLLPTKINRVLPNLGRSWKANFVKLFLWKMREELSARENKIIFCAIN